MELPPDAGPAVIDKFMHIFPADTKSSQLVDLEHGRPLELEWLSGALHRFGKDLGIPTPIHSTIFAALKPFMQGAAQ